MSDEIQRIDPSEILYSVPTIANSLPPLTSIENDDELTIFPIHEDDWSQIEFLHPSQLQEVQQEMREFSVFETKNRRGVGWQNIYLRKFVHKPLFSSIRPKKKLLEVLGTEDGNPPIIHSSREITGLVKNGFTSSIGSGIVLYGYTQGMKVSGLGASIDENPDNEALVSVFSKLNAKWSLVLVDWHSQFILTGVAESGQIEVWRP